MTIAISIAAFDWRKEQMISLSKARIFTSLDEVPFGGLFSKRKNGVG
jgi:hypothetical protein